MKIYQKNEPTITQMNLLMETKILAGILAETFMDFMGFMEDLVLAKEIKGKNAIRIL